MLEQRVKINQNKFRVLKESGTDREVFFGTFRLEENPDEHMQLKKMSYWDGGASFEQELKKDSDTCVCVIEKEGEVIVEKYEFYYTPYQDTKELRLSIEKAKKYYGDNAYLITIEWVECRAEPISSRYIYLENTDGERFYFLRDTIEAMNPDGKRLMDQYITRLPYDRDIKDFRLVAAPIVHQKYVVTE